MKISPYDTVATIASPDGRIMATIPEAHEIGMGAPTTGDLVLSNGLRFDDCNPSMVWSDDSRYLAIPQWTDYSGRRGLVGRQGQRLLIISVRDGQFRYAPWLYHVMELESFEGGIVTGLDHGINPPGRFVFGVASLDWD